MFLLKIPYRSLIYRKKQYSSLFLVCMFGVAISLFCIFLTAGMMDSLNSKAKIYYGGDFQFLCSQNNVLQTYRCEEDIEILKHIFPPESVIVPRFDFDAQNSTLYFEGTGVRQRVIKGVDFEREKDLFEKLNFVSGDALSIKSTNGILLSEPIASMLGVSAGDVITLKFHNIDGYLSTPGLEVKGIFRDSSLFGMYTSYMDLDFLRQSYGVSDSNFANRIAISIKNKTLSDQEVLQIYNKLKNNFNMYDFIDNKQLFYDKMAAFSEPTYALIPLAANLSDAQVLIEAMNAIVTVIIILLVLIIVAGIGSTYRVLVMKRINEIGIYMSLGTSRTKIYIMLLLEAMLLILTACLAGIVASYILCCLTSFFDFSFIPAFDIFLLNGKLVPVYHLTSACNLLMIVLLSTLTAVAFAVRKSVSLLPAKALQETE